MSSERHDPSDDFDWRDYLLLAQRLQELPPDDLRDAFLRSAVSRATYAIYHQTIRDVRRRAGFMPKGLASDHQAVVDMLRSEGMHEYAERLQRLRKMRNKCDYGERVGNLEHMARIAIAIAIEIDAQSSSARHVIAED